LLQLSSPVASLVPSLVLNAVVTLGSLWLGLAAIPLRRVPVLRDPGRRLMVDREDGGEYGLADWLKQSVAMESTGV
jgi:hypothetical protein